MPILVHLWYQSGVVEITLNHHDFAKAIEYSFCTVTHREVTKYLTNYL